MAKLLFLIIVFILAVGLSFYFSAEGFEVIDVVALKAGIEAPGYLLHIGNKQAGARPNRF